MNRDLTRATGSNSKVTLKNSAARLPMMSLIKSKVKRDQLVVKIQSNTARVKRRERQVSDWEVGYNGASADWRSRGFDRREHRL